jgi:ferritin-like metal-binding protein YciE
MPAKKTARKQARQAKSSPEPQELLLTELREIYSAENQLAKAMPRIVKAIESDSVREMFERRLEEGERLIEAIDAAFEQMGASPGRKKNVAAEGLIADTQQHIQEMQRGPALDAVLIGAIQKTEHYCIAAWGTAKAFATALEEEDVVEAMESALEEGKAFDEELTQIAEEESNPAMMEAGQEEEEMDEEPPRRGGRGRRGSRGEARA